MSTDIHYIPAAYFQEYLVDKDTGYPLAGGIVTFYKDQARTELKPIYQQTGSPPNYSYTVLPNPCILSSVGTFQDEGGSDIIPYFYPFDANGDIELYYITVENADEVSQFTREGEPYFAAEAGINSEQAINYIPNGQFLLHWDLPNDGLIDVAETYVAPGGWVFQRPGTSTAIDYVNFDRYASYTINPVGSPRYAIELHNQTPSSGDTYKYLQIRFSDVNKFASDTDEYTLMFFGQSLSGASIDIGINVIKNFGTGGSTQEVTSIEVITVTTALNAFNITFNFGANEGKTIGSADDDYVAIAFNLPTSYPFDIKLTDVALFLGMIKSEVFPITTNQQFIYRSLENVVPAFDGSNLYLPLMLSRGGIVYDNSRVGEVYQSVKIAPASNELILDGTAYDSLEYNSVGIPYSRIANFLWNADPHTPGYIWGSGPNFVTALYSSTGTFTINYNKTADLDVTDGETPTNFDFNSGTEEIDQSDEVHSDNISILRDNKNGQSFTAGLHGVLTSISLWINSIAAGGTSYMTIRIREGEGYSGDILYTQTYNLIGSYPDWEEFVFSDPPYIEDNQKYTIEIYGISALGVYFGYDSTGSYAGGQMISNNSYDFMFKTSVDPGAQTITTVVTEASIINKGGYFNLYTEEGNHYVIWYRIDGDGDQPVEAGAYAYLMVDLLSTYSADDVANKTIEVINRRYFYLPNLGGYFIRITDDGAGNDPDATTRTAIVPGAVSGDIVGSIQACQVQNHSHLASGSFYIQAGGMGGQHGTDWTLSFSSLANTGGGNQTNPLNVYLNAFIVI